MSRSTKKMCLVLDVDVLNSVINTIWLWSRDSQMFSWQVHCEIIHHGRVLRGQSANLQKFCLSLRHKNCLKFLWNFPSLRKHLLPERLCISILFLWNSKKNATALTASLFQTLDQKVHFFLLCKKKSKIPLTGA